LEVKLRLKQKVKSLEDDVRIINKMVHDLIKMVRSQVDIKASLDEVKAEVVKQQIIMQEHSALLVLLKHLK